MTPPVSLPFLTRFLCLFRNQIFPEINNTFIYFSSSLKTLDHLKDASIVKLFFPRDFLLTNDSLHQNRIKNTINLGKVVHLCWLHWPYKFPSLVEPVSSSFFFFFFLVFSLQEHISGTFHRRCSQSILFWHLACVQLSFSIILLDWQLGLYAEF